MNIIDIILKKKNKLELNEEEIKYVIQNYINNNIKDYQMGSLLMAIVINGMTSLEISYLTKYMVDSGNKLDLSNLEPIVDKHSTGGIGDKTTLIVAPLVASCGVNVAKMSGRGLGFTGGTIDKLESIPGFRVNMTDIEFEEQVKKIGLAIISQTTDLAIADKKIYALRDVTGTVESIPLIASSIMSKKIASGAKKIVLDVKVGNGAFIKDLETARELANLMVNIGRDNNIKVICLLTNMDIPLGSNIGNSLEIEEVIDILKNKNISDLTALCLEIATYMVSLGLNLSYEDSKKKVTDNFYNGNAYNKFLELVKYQGGDINNLPKSKYIYNIISNKEGYLIKLNALELGKLSCSLGSGRLNKEDEIDYSVGIVLNKKINDYVKNGEVIGTIHSNRKIDSITNNLYEIGLFKTEYKLIYEIVC